MLELIKAQLNTTVPFARHVGVAIDHVEAGRASASLDQRDETCNHIGSQHAGALFTLAEAATGAAMAGAFAEMLAEAVPVAASAEVRYLKMARGRIVAEATTADAPAVLRDRLSADGTVRFPVTVTLSDANATTVAEMTVDWHVRRRARG